MSKHTTTPWKVYAEGRVTEVHDKSGKAIVPWLGFDDSDIPLATHRANARLIVKSVNNSASMEAELARLREFARAMIELADWPDGGDIDGFDFHDAAVKFGVLVPEQRTEPCDEDCNCNQYYSDDEWKDGITCYRIAAALK